MTSNSTIRHTNAALLSVTKVEADVVVPSSYFDDELKDTYKRLKMPKGLLKRLAGISERRYWAEGDSFDQGAARAGRAAMEQAGVSPEQIGLVINASVTRDNFEPAVAVGVHHALGLGRHALNFDMTNACLGFVNGITVASSMIDAGAIDYALIVCGEDPSPWHETALRLLKDPESTKEDVIAQFATLTLGCGAAAAVIGRADQHPEGHRIKGSVSRAGTEHLDLCIGGEAGQGMSTDATGLLEHGLKLVTDAWHQAHEDGWDWQRMDSYVTHQVSTSHTNAIVDAVDLDPQKVPVTFPTWGNVAAAALPMTLAQESQTLRPGQRVLCMGVGSGLNTALMEIEW